MQELKDNFGQIELQSFMEVPNEGERVTITDKAFYGLEAVVLRVLPAKERVQVLLEMLGRTATVEFQLSAVATEKGALARTFVLMA